MKIKLANNIKDKSGKPLEINFPEDAKGNIPRLYKTTIKEAQEEKEVYSDSNSEDVGISYQLSDGSKESFSAKPDPEKINLNKFNKITSKVGGDNFLSNNQDNNFEGEDKTFGNSASNLGNQLANMAGSLVGADNIAGAANMFSGPAELTGLASDIIALEQWKGKKYKDIHTYDWNSKITLNRGENVANSAMNDLRGELGKTTGGLGGAAIKSPSENAWVQGARQILDTLAGGASNTNMVGNVIGEVTGKDIADSAWNTDADELTNLNTVTKDTIYTSKPGIRFKAKPGMVQNITNDEESITVFGSSRYTKDGEIYRNTYGNTLEKFRNGQINNSKTSIIRRLILNNNNTFNKKQPIYSLKKGENGELANVSYDESGNITWEKSPDLFTGFNLSDEEMQLITLLKNRNTFNKKLGYIYIRPFYEVKNSEEEAGFRTFDIPFEFTPRISEGAMQANYQTETLLGRLGQFQIYTGTNLSTLNIELEYIALAPDNFDTQESAEIYRQYGTDAWQYYWTNNRVEAIEMKLRSLVLANYVDSDYLIKPPLVEIHLENSNGYGAETIGDLYKYPNGIKESEESISLETSVGKNYLQYSTALNGDTGNRYKKYVVNSVQIDNISDSDILYPSLYGRKFNNDYSDKRNTMYHIDTYNSANSDRKAMGWAGYSRKKGFKATLQLTEVTENFLDLVPDFKAYYDAWRFKEATANYVNEIVSEAVYGNGGDKNIYHSVKDTLETAVSTFKNSLLEAEQKLDGYYKEAELLAKLYACSLSEIEKENNKMRYYIGKYNNESEEFSFLKKEEIELKNGSEIFKPMLKNGKYFNFSNGLEINNYKDKNKPIIDGVDKVLTLSKCKNKDFLNKIIYKDTTTSVEEKDLLNSEEEKKGLSDFLFLFDNNNFQKNIFIPFWSDETIIDKNGKIKFSVALEMASKTEKVIDSYINIDEEEIKTNINEFDIKFNPNNPNNAPEEEIEKYSNKLPKEIEKYLDEFDARLEAYKTNVRNFITNVCNCFLNDDKTDILFFNSINQSSAKGKKLIEKIRKSYNLLKSIGNEPSDKDIELVNQLKDLNDYLLKEFDEFKSNYLLELAKRATDNPDVLMDKNVNIYKISQDPNKGIFSPALTKAEVTGVNLGFISTCLENIIKSNKMIKKINTEEDYKKTAEKFTSDNDPRQKIKNAKNECLIKNAMVLLGLSNDNYFYGIVKENSKAASFYLPYIFNPKDEIDFYFGDTTTLNNYLGSNLLNFGLDYNISEKIEAIFESKNQGYSLSSSCDYKVKQTNLKVITFKEILKAICEAHDEAKKAFEDLAEENKSMISIDTSELKNLSFTNDLEKSFEDLAKKIDAFKGPWKSSKNNTFNFDSLSFTNSLPNYSQIAISISEFFKNDSDVNYPKIMDNDVKNILKWENICRQTYSRDEIESRFQLLANEKLDKIEELTTLNENLNGLSTYIKGVELADNEKYYCYKINREYTLKEKNFKNAENSIKDDDEEEGHGIIYNTYKSSKAIAKMTDAFSRSSSTSAIENYNVLTT